MTSPAFPCRVPIDRLIDQYRDSLDRFQFVGLHGKKRSGKDTFYNGLLHLFGDQPDLVRKAAFGDPLKEVAEALFGGGRDKWHGTEEQRSEIDDFWLEALGVEFASGRKSLQYLGTDVMRALFCDEIWILATLRRILRAADSADPGSVFVFTDVRFPNEVAFCKALDARLIKVINLNQTDTVAEHSSEAGVEGPFDLVVESESAQKTWAAGWAFGLDLLGCQDAP